MANPSRARNGSWRRTASLVRREAYIHAGYARQRINAKRTDISRNFGLETLHIPGSNGPDPLQGDIPAFQFNTFSNLGNPNTGNPFLFRDNQYAGKANLTWVKGKHQFRFGVEYNNTQLNHFLPQGGSFQTARGSFHFAGAVTELKAQAVPPGAPQYNSFADFLLVLPDEVFNRDMSLMRNFKLWEWLTFQFEAEAFGVRRTLTIRTQAPAARILVLSVRRWSPRTRVLAEPGGRASGGLRVN